MHKHYEQTTYETCLACTLLTSAQRFRTFAITQKLELACIVSSMKFSKFDFASGHTRFIEKKFKLLTERIVEFPTYARAIARKNLARVHTARVDLTLIDSLVHLQPIIVLDMNMLYPLFHYPHWIIVLSRQKKTYRIYDPGTGKVKNVPRATISKGIDLLRKHLLMSPQLIVVRELSVTRK